MLSLRGQQDAILCGKHAVRLALSGKTGVMATIEFVEGKTVCGDVELSKVANAVKCVPQKYISQDGAHITSKFDEYILPIVEGEVKLNYEYGIPRYFDNSALKKLNVK